MEDFIKRLDGGKEAFSDMFGDLAKHVKDGDHHQLRMIVKKGVLRMVVVYGRMRISDSGVVVECVRVIKTLLEGGSDSNVILDADIDYFALLAMFQHENDTAIVRGAMSIISHMVVNQTLREALIRKNVHEHVLRAMANHKADVEVQRLSVTVLAMCGVCANDALRTVALCIRKFTTDRELVYHGLHVIRACTLLSPRLSTYVSADELVMVLRCHMDDGAVATIWLDLLCTVVDKFPYMKAVFMRRGVVLITSKLMIKHYNDCPLQTAAVCLLALLAHNNAKTISPIFDRYGIYDDIERAAIMHPHDICVKQMVWAAKTILDPKTI